MGALKTTIELPDELFREAKATAARRGQSLKTYVREAIEEKLGLVRGEQRASEPTPEYLTRDHGRTSIGTRKLGPKPPDDGGWPYPPMPLSPEERAEIDRAIEEAFEQIDLEDWA